jgi:hypothetical protein
VANRCGEHEGFRRAVEVLLSLLHPLGHDIAHDREAARLHLVVGPLAIELGARAGHVDLLRGVDLERREPAVGHELVRGRDVHDVCEELAQAFREWRRGEAHDDEALALDELAHAVVDHVRLVHDEQLHLVDAAAAGERLRARNLDASPTAAAPVVALHDAVVDAVLVERAAGLIDEGYPIDQRTRRASLWPSPPASASWRSRSCRRRWRRRASGPDVPIERPRADLLSRVPGTDGELGSLDPALHHADLLLELGTLPHELVAALRRRPQLALQPLDEALGVALRCARGRQALDLVRGGFELLA